MVCAFAFAKRGRFINSEQCRVSLTVAAALGVFRLASYFQKRRLISSYERADERRYEHSMKTRRTWPGEKDGKTVRRREKRERERENMMTAAL